MGSSLSIGRGGGSFEIDDELAEDNVGEPSLEAAQRLPNGNTLIADGPHGVILEVTPAADKVWEYVNPYFDSGAEVVRLNDQEVFQTAALFRAECPPTIPAWPRSLDEIGRASSG